MLLTLTDEPRAEERFFKDWIADPKLQASITQVMQRYKFCRTGGEVAEEFSPLHSSGQGFTQRESQVKTWFNPGSALDFCLPLVGNPAESLALTGQKAYCFPKPKSFCVCR